MTRLARDTLTQADGLQSAFQRLDDGTFYGHAFSPAAPLVRFTVEILIDGAPAALRRAEEFDAQLCASGSGDGCYAFTFTARPERLAGRRTIEARLANIGTPVGQPIDLATTPCEPAPARAGTVEWAGGLRLTGMVFNGDPAASPRVRAFEDGALVAEIAARRWLPVRKPGDPLDAVRFDLRLPREFADGRLHLLTVRDDHDRELEGSPVALQAFDDGLRAHLADTASALGEDARAEWFDRLLPMSAPFASYPRWKERFERPASSAGSRQAVRVVLIGTRGADEAAERLAQQDHANWSAACVPSPDGATFNWAELKAALKAGAEENVVAVFADARTALRPHALNSFVAALAAHRKAAAAYGDIEIVDEKGSAAPVFFGAFDYERMLEQGYAAHVFAVRAGKVAIPHGERKGSLARLFLALFDKAGPAAGEHIVHIPGVLAAVPAPDARAHAAHKAATAEHLRKRGVAAEIAPAVGSLFPALRVRRKAAKGSLVSIVIATRDRADSLAACLDSLRATTKGATFEIVIADSDSASAAARAVLDKSRRNGDRVVGAPGPLNRSELFNRGVKAARGAFVCLLDGETEIADSGWLGELLSRLAEPDAGAAAPLVVSPDGMVRHAGIVLGTTFSAADAFTGCMAGDTGYGDLLRAAHEASAASAACLLVRRKDYIAAGGFDAAAFPGRFNDVDFCLRLRAAGKRIVVTPHATVIDRGAGARARETAPDEAARARRELAELRRRWGAVLAADPAYSPFLNLDPDPYSGLAWPPRPAAARGNEAGGRGEKGKIQGSSSS